MTHESVSFRPAVAEIPFQRVEIKNVNPNSLDLTVGKIEKVENHPDADKLYILQISLGDRKIQLVAGLRKYYSIDQILGKKIIVVANLKKARFRGMESEGMLLAADDGTSTHFLTVSDSVQPGTKIKIGPYTFNGTKVVTIDELASYKLLVTEKGEVSATLGSTEGILLAGNEPVRPESPVGAGARVR